MSLQITDGVWLEQSRVDRRGTRRQGLRYWELAQRVLQDSDPPGRLTPGQIHSMLSAVTADHSPTTPPTLDAIVLRAKAAFFDMCIVGALCATLMWSQLVSSAHHPALNWIAGILLAAAMLLELLTGLTLGKLFFHLSLRRFVNPTQSPPLWSLLLRGLIRLLPVLIFLPALLVTDNMLTLLIWLISLAMVICYLTTCYLTLLRRGRTLFDLAAGTVAILS
jgi:hypothetical protein